MHQNVVSGYSHVNRSPVGSKLKVKVMKKPYIWFVMGTDHSKPYIRSSSTDTISCAPEVSHGMCTAKGSGAHNICILDSMLV